VELAKDEAKQARLLALESSKVLANYQSDSAKSRTDGVNSVWRVAAIVLGLVIPTLALLAAFTFKGK
jgi:hypothetical protein